MGFGERARRVRDGRLAHGRRVAALCSCVGLYHPIGHRATLSFLAELAGPYQRHERALLRALEALEASRAVWRAEVTAYVASRVQEKRLGRRPPPPGDPPRSRMSGHWYASTPELSRRAAVHALKLWDLEPSPARDLRPTPARDLRPSPARDVEPGPAVDLGPGGQGAPILADPAATGPALALEPGPAVDEVRALVRCCLATGGRLPAEQLAAVAGPWPPSARWPMALVASAAGLRK
ncbi:hypothetical protein [Amycolatopsis sp. NPDC049159]|uniref:hypothetical protein n=1 Tax=Amycolatopsis sp. NPDC049159 TaxID=3157210 RepID=UPI0033CB8782